MDRMLCYKEDRERREARLITENKEKRKNNVKVETHGFGLLNNEYN